MKLLLLLLATCWARVAEREKDEGKLCWRHCMEGSAIKVAYSVTKYVLVTQNSDQPILNDIFIQDPKLLNCHRRSTYPEKEDFK